METLANEISLAGRWIEYAIRSAGATPEAVGAAVVLLVLVFLIGQMGASALREV